MGYTFDRKLGRFRDASTGRLIAESVVRSGVDRLCDLTSARMAGYSRALLDGTLSLADWQQQMMADLKSSQVAAGVAAMGGRKAMTPADWGTIGQRVREQYRYLRAFATDISSGRQPLDGRLSARAQQYGQAARPTYESIRARNDLLLGYTHERNVLHGHDHCQQCPTLTALGWVPIGSLPMIGQRACRVHDRCTIQRRKTAPRPS